MSDLRELLERKAKLEHEAKQLEEQLVAARRAEKQEAIAKIQSMMRESGITVEDLGGIRRVHSATVRKTSGIRVAPKYRNNDTGETWTGRGLQPKWVVAGLASGKTLEDFKI